MGARVAVAGASGYAGGELLRLLAGHPDLEIGPVTAASSAGQPIGAVHAHLAGVPALAGRVFEPHETSRLDGCDLIFAALPAGQSAALAAGLPAAAKVVDLGPDFRLADPEAWARYYGGEHAGRWVTGLPELPGLRERIAAADRVAAPGCYATAAILALVPVVAAGLAEPQDIVVVAASGTSGAGRSLRASLLASEVMGSVSAYQVGGTHRHTAEIEQALTETRPARTAQAGTTTRRAGTVSQAGTASQAGTTSQAGTVSQAGAVSQAATASQAGAGQASGNRPVTVSFTPILAPMPRGILATCTARLADPATGTAELRAALTAAYQDEPFVTVLPEGAWPVTAAVAGSNGVHVQAAADPRAGRAVVVAAIDNLGKGAAGQAVQNANLMLGLPEAAGLTVSGVAP